MITMSASNKSLDASGGSVFLNLLDAAKGALIRAAASTPPFGCYATRRWISEEQDHSDTSPHLRTPLLGKDDARKGPRTRTAGTPRVARRVDLTALWGRH